MSEKLVYNCTFCTHAIITKWVIKDGFKTGVDMSGERSFCTLLHNREMAPEYMTECSAFKPNLVPV